MPAVKIWILELDGRYVPDVDVLTRLGVPYDEFYAWWRSDWPSVLRFTVLLSIMWTDKNTKDTNLIPKSAHSSTDWLLDHHKAARSICQHHGTYALEEGKLTCRPYYYPRSSRYPAHHQTGAVWEANYEM